MEAREGGMGRRFDAGKDFHRGKPRCLFRQVVPQERCVHHGEGPQGKIDLVGPMNDLMEKHGARPGGYGLNGALGYTVLEMSTHSAKIDMLIIEIEVLAEGGCVEGHIVCSIGFDTRHVMITSPSLELTLGLEAVADP